MFRTASLLVERENQKLPGWGTENRVPNISKPNFRELTHPPLEPRGTRLVLASTSPARARLLRSLRHDFTVLAPHDRERLLDPARVGPFAFVQAQAYLKARDVADRILDGEFGGPAQSAETLVIGADTVTVLDGQILGKPRDRVEAAAMLSALSGREHRVITGVAVVHVGTGRRRLRPEVSRLVMRELTPTEVAELAARPEALSVAGGYALCEVGPDPYVTLRAGSVSNVVGLPVELLSRMLSDFGEP